MRLSLSLTLMSLLYLAAGAMHFARPTVYLRMMPPYLPAPLTLIYLSGLAEMALGALLWVPSLRPWAAWGIVVLLIAVFPANLYMYQQGGASYQVADWVLLLRLPAQALLIAWAHSHTAR